MPTLDGITETALYVDDLPRAVEFYRSVFELEVLRSDVRFCALNVGNRQVLLLFQRGASTSPVPIPGGMIPPHDGAGPAHVGFAIAASSLGEWETRLREKKIPIESRVTWPLGGTSLYFRDPDGHAVELLTPGVWKIY